MNLLWLGFPAGLCVGVCVNVWLLLWNHARRRRAPKRDVTLINKAGTPKAYEKHGTAMWPCAK